MPLDYYTPEVTLTIISVTIVACIAFRTYYGYKIEKIVNVVRREYYQRECELKKEMNELRIFFSNKENQYVSDIKSITSKYDSLHNKYVSVQSKLIQETDNFREVINNDPPFCKIASLVADSESLFFNSVSGYLTAEKRAYKSAEIVRELKQKYRDLMQNYKELQYKYEYMLSQFPELTNYIEEHSYEIMTGASDDEYDHARNWLSKEEYDSLSEDERNQKALDNWLTGHHRTNSEVGFDYEMYIGYRYRSSNRFKWRVEQFGISRGLNDLGRDIIATREDPSSKSVIVNVVQCKYWSQERQIHENVIAQLYGTAVMYRLEHSDDAKKRKFIVKPILVTSTALTETAERFAKYLGVKVMIEPMDDYPRIKCNINRSTGEKIYHLPFDQQYHNVKIEDEGELYVSTVAEAVSRGFRRAHKHLSFL